MVSVRGKKTSSPAGELDRLLADYLAAHPAPVVTDAEYHARLAHCGSCGNQRGDGTCCHSGKLVALLAKIATERCGNPKNPKW